VPQNNKSIITERRKRVAEMYLAGKWQSEIGKELNVTQQCVSQDLAVLRRLWLQSAAVNIDKIKSRELAKIDRLEDEAWIAWARSLKAKTKHIEKTGNKESSTTDQTEESFGDPRFMQTIQWCIAKRCEIFGLNAPFKLDTTSKGESMKPLNVIVDSAETADTLNKLIEAARSAEQTPQQSEAYLAGHDVISLA